MPFAQRGTSARADGVWGDVGSTHLILLAGSQPDRHLVNLMTLDGFYWNAGPWQLRVPEHFRQSHGLGTSAVAWTTREQQTWYSLHLVIMPGEIPLDGLTILGITEQNSEDRSDRELFVMLSVHPIRRGAGNCMTAQPVARQCSWIVRPMRPYKRR